MFKLLRRIWAERAALEILELSWKVGRDYAYRNAKGDVDKVLSNLDELAVKLAKSHSKITDTLLEGDDTNDEEIIRNLKD